jgi:transcriptional regulator with XRE-family HTH domain
VDVLKELRRRRGWSQRELAEESGVGQDTVSGIESGRHEPRPSTLRKLAAALDVEVADFFREPALPKVEPPPLSESLSGGGAEQERSPETARIFDEVGEDDPFDGLSREQLVRVMNRYSRAKGRLSESQDETVRRVGGEILDRMIFETIRALTRKRDRTDRTQRPDDSDAGAEAG